MRPASCSSPLFSYSSCSPSPRLCDNDTFQRSDLFEHARFNSSEEDSGGKSSSDVEEVPETIFGVNSSSPNNYSEEMGEQHSGDLFKIYDMLKKKKLCGEAPSSSFNAKVMNTSQEVHEEVNSESAGQRVVNNGGSVLGVMEDMIRVGQAMGYSMDGCVKDFEFIIGNQGDEAVLR
ncbi:hypothetical protein Tco_1082145 [Tanacetum coccineum]|uniref:Uncharacterized protein n=1 Tax=Tanacetum coccineum TaxID=301880 RepID=A0ABQ5I113_9ASTR